MRFEPLPPFATWRHHDAREGFEVAFFDVDVGGLRIAGSTVAVEDRKPFAVRYEIVLDERWRTRYAHVSGQSPNGTRAVTLETDGHGRWLVDGRPGRQLDGCLDVDLESSTLTNAFPMRRLGLAPGEAADAPAAYVRALDLGVERLDQHYERIDDGTGNERYDYACPAFNVRCELAYDAAGLVLDYPGIAIRAEGGPRPS